jgi:surfactin synthase thioesterase subunit
MLDWLALEIRKRDPGAWMVVGHSMGGKLATLIAARSEHGDLGLAALAGVVLLAGSPPSPEPMDEDRRTTMLGWATDGAISQVDAETFVDANISSGLAQDLRTRAVADVMRADPVAWRAWLTRGSREDWSEEAGRIAAPALLIAGADDGDLDAEAQGRLNLPHFARGRVETVADAAHLLPYEQPEAVARLIDDHWRGSVAHALPEQMARLLASDRVGTRTRHALLARRLPPTDDTPTCLAAAQRETLTSILARILPDVGAGEALGRQLEAALAMGQGDGWRFADLPPDVEAWRAGLDALEGFAGLDERAQDARLEALAAGGVAGACLTASQMKFWFEDVRAEAVRTWLALPATMARIGYDGFANGGDGDRIQGYGETAADRVEAWQLHPTGGDA